VLPNEKKLPTKNGKPVLDCQIDRSDPWPLSERHYAADRAASAIA
jgi:hypothetical protein